MVCTKPIAYHTGGYWHSILTLREATGTGLETQGFLTTDAVATGEENYKFDSANFCTSRRCMAELGALQALIFPSFHRVSALTNKQNCFNRRRDPEVLCNK